jgi:prepilin peptidase CpaA
MMEFLPLLLLAPVLILVGYYDLKLMLIPNRLVVAAIALFVLTAPFVGWPEIALRLGAAAAVFAIGFALFALRLFGGGDVKMMAALLLFVPSTTYTAFALGFSAAMFAGIGVILALRAAPFLAGSGWVSLQRPGTFPMGISIAMTGLAHPLVANALA